MKKQSHKQKHLKKELYNYKSFPFCRACIYFDPEEAPKSFGFCDCIESNSARLVSMFSYCDYFTRDKY